MSVVVLEIFMMQPTVGQSLFPIGTVQYSEGADCFFSCISQSYVVCDVSLFVSTVGQACPVRQPVTDASSILLDQCFSQESDDPGRSFSLLNDGSGQQCV